MTQRNPNRPPPPSRRAGGELEPGSLVSERYRIDAPIGEGAMGRVYAAEHVLLRKKVAIKLLRADRAHVPEVAARFEREAMASANIEHPNIAGASDFGRLEDGSVYLVLEYVQGKSLRKELAGGPLPIARSLHIARQIASALVAAEERGIVHRDLKPENVMLVEKLGDSDFVKVLDFGIARVPMAEKEDGALTKVGVVFGTPEYMAPEQALGQRVDSRADLFALGVILFEMIAGIRPYRDTKSPAVKLAEAPARLSDHAPKGTITPALDDLVQRLIEPDLRKRFARVTDALSAIEAVAADFGPHLPEVPSGTRVATPAAASSERQRDPLQVLPTFLPGDPLPSYELPSDAESGLTAPSGVEGAALEPKTLLFAPSQAAGPPESPAGSVAPKPERQPTPEAPPRKVEAPAPAAPSLTSPETASAEAPDPSAAPAPASPAATPPRSPGIGARLLALHRGACQFIDERRDQLPRFIRRRVKHVPASTLLGACAVFGAVLGVSGVATLRALALKDVPSAPSASAVPVVPADIIDIPDEAPSSSASAAPSAEAKPADSAESPVERAKAELAQGHDAEALELLGGALRAEPKLAADEGVQAALLQVLRSKKASSVDAAFALLQGPMGSNGADVLYDAAFDPELSRATRERAAAWLRTKDFDRISTPALYSAVKLRFAASCQQKFQLLRLAQNQGGKRTLLYLQELAKKTSCNVDGCFPCLEHEGRLKEAITTIEERLAAR